MVPPFGSEPQQGEFSMRTAIKTDVVVSIIATLTLIALAIASLVFDKERGTQNAHASQTHVTPQAPAAPPT
jgi:hypothetical protein